MGEVSSGSPSGVSASVAPVDTGADLGVASTEGKAGRYLLNPALYTTGAHVDGDLTFRHGEPVDVDTNKAAGRVITHKTTQFGREHQTVVTESDAEGLRKLLDDSKEGDVSA